MGSSSVVVPIMAWLPVALLLVVIGAALRRGWARRSPTTGGVERFAKAWHLRLTGETAAVISNYLTGTRRWRRGGAAAGVAAGAGAGVAWSSGILSVLLAGLVGGVVGYFVGSVLAEASARLGPAEGGPRTAELHVRTRHEYLDPRMFAVVVLAPIVGTALFVSRIGGDGFDWPTPLALLLVAGCIVAALELGIRRVVRRPRPSGDADMVAVCDAIAASAAQVLVSSGGCVVFWSLAWEALATTDGGEPTVAIHTWVGIFDFVIAVAFWAQRNRIERPATAEPVA